MTDCNVIHPATDDNADPHQFSSSEDKLDACSQFDAVAIDESYQSCLNNIIKLSIHRV